MDKEKALGYFSDLKQLGVEAESILISGGEPFLYKDEMIDILKAGQEVFGDDSLFNILTNGSWCKNDSMVRETYEAIRSMCCMVCSSMGFFHLEHIPFASIDDLCQRVNLQRTNRRALECLIRSGAMDSLAHRGGLLKALDKMIGLSRATNQAKEVGQMGLFGEGGIQPGTSDSLIVESNAADDLPVKQKLSDEKELLGIYISEDTKDYLFESGAQDPIVSGWEGVGGVPAIREYTSGLFETFRVFQEHGLPIDLITKLNIDQISEYSLLLVPEAM